jgi:hypothetical protein
MTAGERVVDESVDNQGDKAVGGTVDKDAVRPTSATDRPNLSTEHQKDGDARRPSDTLDKGQGEGETIPRKSSLTGTD